MSALLTALENSFSARPTGLVRGKVHAIRGSVLTAHLPTAVKGQLGIIHRPSLPPLHAQVVGFEGSLIQLLPLDHPEGVAPGSMVELESALTSHALEGMGLGSVVDALGRVLDRGGAALPVPLISENILNRAPPCALSRAPLRESFITGVKLIDGLCPLAIGQRIGLFAPAGVGKSTLLATIARNAKCDAVVVGLIGERGREVNEFLQETLGEEGRRKSVVVCATSDEPPAKRLCAAYTATAIAESYREQGKHVLLLIDSLTRVARALREVSLCLGELPVRHGFPPSVFTELPRLLERAGSDQHGSITAFYSVLCTEDEPDPLADELTSLLDGHLRMTNAMALKGIRPAIDPSRSLSRLMPRLRSAAEQADIQLIVQSFAKLQREKDMLLFGATPDPFLAHLLQLEPTLHAFLAQSAHACVPEAETKQELATLASKIRAGSK